MVWSPFRNFPNLTNICHNFKCNPYLTKVVTWYITTLAIFDDQHFRDKFKSNKNLSMFHLNIRSIPEHVIQLTSYIDSLDIVFKIIAISETWLKLDHADYIILNYNAEKDIRLYKRGGGVSLYIHSSL